MFQDWWNVIVWSKPSLAFLLDCGFNFQINQEFNKYPFKEVGVQIYIKNAEFTVTAV